MQISPWNVANIIKRLVSENNWSSLSSYKICNQRTILYNKFQQTLAKKQFLIEELLFEHM